MMSHVGEANKNRLLVKCTWFLKKRQTVCSLLLLFQRETIPVFKRRQFRFIRWMLEQCNVRGCFHIKRYIQSSTKKIKIIFIFLFTQCSVCLWTKLEMFRTQIYVCMYILYSLLSIFQKKIVIQIWKYVLQLFHYDLFYSFIILFLIYYQWMLIIY